MNHTIKTGTVFLFALVIVSHLPAEGYTVSGNTYNTNGSSSDVQAAINAAPSGATIRIPAGNFSWSTPVSLSTPLHLVGAGANATTITCGVANNGSLNVTCSTAGNIEVAGISFVEGNFAPQYEALVNVSGASTGQPANPNGVVLLHDCNFAVNQNGEDCLRWETNGGVIWNCTFSSQDIDCIGVCCKDALGSTQPGDPWQSRATMGTADTTGLANTYIENCTFTDMFLQSINLDDNSRTVVRYNTFNNSAIGSHGQETSPWGVRHYEIYHNNFVFSSSGNTPFGNSYPLNLNYWFQDRGGTGCIFNNTVPDIQSQTLGSKATWLLADFNIQRAANNILFQLSYPSARQVGQTWIGSGGYSYPGAPVDGSGYGIDPLYIWGNTAGQNAQAAGLEDYPDQSGNGLLVGNFIVLNRDFYLNAKPNYSPYAYPHPLRSVVSASPSPTATPTPKPTPTPAATVTPAPTPDPTPNPTPTPTPTPASVAGPYQNWIGQLNAWMQQNGYSAQNVQLVDNFVQADPPFTDQFSSPSGFVYWQWQGQLNWSLQNGGSFTSGQVGNLDAFIQSNPPSKN